MQPLIQKSTGITGDGKILVIWRSNELDNTENNNLDITYFIVQYYEIISNSRIINSKLVPKNYNKKEYSTIINGLKNDVQYLVQVVGVNKNGIGKIEEGNILIPEKGGILLK